MPANITPNDSILRSSSLETSIRTMNMSHRYSSGPAPLPVAQQKTYAPPFVSLANEFQAEHIGRFFYLFGLVGVEKLSLVFALMSFVFNFAVWCTILFEDLCFLDAKAHRKKKYFVSLLLAIPILAHFCGVQGARNRKILYLGIFFAYSTIEILFTLGINIFLIVQHFLKMPCSMHVTLVANMTGTLCFFQMCAAYFTHENICYVRWYIQGNKSSQRYCKHSTIINTLTNSRRTNSTQLFNDNLDLLDERESVAETNITLIDCPSECNVIVEPSENIQDTLQQVISTWRYQRARRRKSVKGRGRPSVKFDDPKEKKEDGDEENKEEREELIVKVDVEEEDGNVEREEEEEDGV